MRFEDTELAEFALRRGDVLICEGGEPGRAAVWDEREENIYFQKAIHRVRLSAAVDPHFFVKMLRVSADNGRLAEYFTGAGIKHLTGKGLSSFIFPIPPLAEQHRIVAKVDELMALCDRLEAAQVERERRRDQLASSSLRRLNRPSEVEARAFLEHADFHLRHLPRLTAKPEHIQGLRQAIINLAVQGRLVPQHHNDEPSISLLKRIGLEQSHVRVRGKEAKQKSKLNAAEAPCVVPAGWEWVRIGDLLLGDSQNGYARKPDNAPNGVPILRISAATIRKDGVIAEEEHKLIGGVPASHQEQYELRPGDLLACRFNGNRKFVGRLALYRSDLGIRPIYPDKLIRLRLPAQFVLPELVRCFAESSVVREDIESYCATTVGNWGISAANLRLVKIPLPPLNEQRRIVAKVDELMALCDRMDAQLTIAKTESSRLLEAVLHEALASAT